MNNDKLVFTVHTLTVRYYDYGTYLHSKSTKVVKFGGNVHYQGNDAVAKFLEKASTRPDDVEVREGAPIVSKCDINPHGLI